MFQGFASEDGDFTNLSPSEIDKSREAFAALDKDGSGYLDKDRLVKAMEMVGYKPNREETIRIITYIDNSNQGMFDYSNFMRAISYYKSRHSPEAETDADYVDAFVAMGGNEDRSGKVDAKRLIEVLKNEFDMTIDIEKMIREIDTDGSGEIEYNEFKAMLSN